MIQTAIDFAPRKLARRDNPATSHQAAAHVHEFAGGHNDIILAVLHERGPCTAHEIAAHCELEAHAIGKRLNEIERRNLARVLMCDGVEITRKTPSGRAARVWEAA